MEAYCMKCKKKQMMDGATPVFTSKGSPATSGTCPVCSTKMYKIGKSDAHEGMTPPQA